MHCNYKFQTLAHFASPTHPGGKRAGEGKGGGRGRGDLAESSGAAVISETARQMDDGKKTKV